ncbi:MAG: class I SAM-dependent methyltransferase [Bdellovibrionales bacterium]|nr:class I SAM-dependent methyltransferase [Bdellovibrionales bacterium]
MKQSIEEIEELSRDRSEPVSSEIHTGNIWYGHAKAIKSFCDLPSDYPIKAVIEHGPKFGSSVEAWETNSPLPAMFVYGNFRYKALAPATNKALFTIGSMLSYTEHYLNKQDLREEKKRLGKSLLVFPTHGTHHIDHKFDLNSYCNDLFELSKNFDSVQVCMYWREITRGWHKNFLDKGFEVVTAGHMYDENFLSRLKSIIEPATLVTSNKMGTHFGYCIQMNKPFYFLSNQKIEFEKSPEGNSEVFAKWASWGDVHQFQENLELIEASSCLQDQISSRQQELANKYWGLDKVKSKEELLTIIEIAESLYQTRNITQPRSFLFNLGSEMLNRDNNLMAEVLLSEASDQIENSNALNYELGLAFARNGNIEAATSALKNFCSEYTQHEKAKLLLAEISESTRFENKEIQNGEYMDNNPKKKNSESEVYDLMEKAHQLILKGNPQKAFELITQAKGLKTPVKGLDYLRAQTFLEMSFENSFGNAREALREELRFFPDNKEAKALLDQILAKEQRQLPEGINDNEFLDLLKTIQPYSMLPDIRLYSLFSLAKHVCINNVEGDFIECGVAGGGSTALLATVIKRYSKIPRAIFACDSYEGMPQPTEHDKFYGKSAESTGWGTGTCAAPEESVLAVSQALGVGELVKIVKGYFEQSLPRIKSEISKIAFMHVDCDWYESTKTVLNELYDHLATGSAVQLDDYGQWEGVDKAVHEFESKKGIKFDIKNIDNCSAWFLTP